MNVHWSQHIRRFVEPRVRGHQRADNDGKGVGLQSRYCEPLRSSCRTLDDKVADLEGGYHLSKGVLVLLVPDLSAGYLRIFDISVPDQPVQLSCIEREGLCVSCMKDKATHVCKERLPHVPVFEPRLSEGLD